MSTDRILKGKKYNTGEIYVTGTRQVLADIHTRDLCRHGHCVIHRPSSHALVNAPTHWRVREVLDSEGCEHAVQVMERICSCGTFHPDPDDLVFILETKGQEAAELAMTHDCCEKKCCQIPASYLSES